MIIIGIDPGLSGAIAAINYMGYFQEVRDLPVCRDHKRAWIHGGQLRDILGAMATVDMAWIESVHAMPKQGVSSAFQFGMGYGSIVGALQSLNVPLQFVPGTQWKKDLNLSRDKEAALHKARLLFPTAQLHLKKHEGRAEALLIAYWAYLKYHRKESP